MQSPICPERGDRARIALLLVVCLLGACDPGGSGGWGAADAVARNRALDTDDNGFADRFDVDGDWTGDGCDGVPDGRETPDDLQCAVLAVSEDPAGRRVRVLAGRFDANAPGYPADLIALLSLPANTRFEMEPGTWLVGYDANTLGGKATSTRLLTTANLVPPEDRRSSVPPDRYAPIGGIDVQLRGGYALPRSGYTTQGWPTLNHFGLYLLQCAGCSVRDGEIADTLHSAVYARSMQGGVIADNVIGPGAGGEFDSSRRARQNGIYLFAANGADVMGVDVLRNEIRGVGKDALHTRGERHWSRTNVACEPGDQGLCEGRRAPGAACAEDADCPGAQRCEATASCLGGASDGALCTSDVDCGSGECVRDRCEAAVVRDSRFARNEVDSAAAFCISVESSERIRYEDQRCADSLVLHVVGAPPDEGAGCDAEPVCVGGDAPGLVCASDADCGIGAPGDPLDDGHCASQRAAGASCHIEVRGLRAERARTPLPAQPDALVEIGSQAQDVLVAGLELAADGANAACVRIREFSRGIAIEDAELFDCGSAAILGPDPGAIAELRLEGVAIDGYGAAPGGMQNALRFVGPVAGFVADALSIVNRDPARTAAVVRFDDGDLSGVSWRDFVIDSDAPGTLGIWLRDAAGAPDRYDAVSFAAGDFLWPAAGPAKAGPAIVQDGAETLLSGFALEDLAVATAPAAEPCFRLDAVESQTATLLVDLSCPTPDIIDGVDSEQVAPPSRVIDDDIPNPGSRCAGDGATWSDGASSRICVGSLWQ